MSTAQITRLTAEEYLERERNAETKSEYYRGEMFAMAGASRRHMLLITNLVRELSERLRQRPCEVYAADLRLAVNPAGLYTYPDVMVVCGAPVFIDNRQDTIINPVLIIEVLSDSTKNYDRGQKFQSYRSLSSLREYLTIAQDEIHVEQHVRQPDDKWILSETDAHDATIALQSVGVELRVSDVYEKTDLRPT